MTATSTGLSAAPKYSILELERRFLVDPAVLPSLDEDRVYVIEDLYVTGSRLRLRKVAGADGKETVYKFCKKYPSDDPLSGPIVNIYLSPAEYELLSVLPGERMRKRRCQLADDTAPFVVDIFEGTLAGLIIAELEARDPDELRAVQTPSWAVREITGDVFFAGNNLAGLDPADLVARLDRELARSTQVEGNA
jgi:CYTH domain-containing protein